jgi:hypothetical protein
VGKQINFFLSVSDQRDLLQRLGNDCNATAALPPLSSAAVKEQDTTEFAEWRPGEHTPIIFRRGDTDGIKLLTRKERHDEYYFDIFSSRAIEFSRSIARDRTISRGRFYFIEGYMIDNTTKFEKPVEFLDWAKSIFQVVRRFCIDKRQGDFIGPDAVAKERAGWKFVQN